MSKYSDTVFNALFKVPPKDINVNGKKTGKIRKAIRAYPILAIRRRDAVMFARAMFSQHPLSKISPRISRHKKRKQSRGFVSNRKSGYEGDRVEWNTLSDTKDK